MANGPLEEGVHRQGAPFSLGLPIGGLLLSLLLLIASPALSLECPPDRLDQQARVGAIFDGDTVRLADGRKVRVIGIDTPEVGHDGEAGQPYAEEARRALAELLAEGGVGLRFDAERHDSYGRELAHLFLDGKSVAAELLEQGLATTLAIPPNLWNQPCYLEAERRAREAGRGIWSLAAYQPVSSAVLPRSARGYRAVEGRVERVGESRRSIWLNLEGSVAIRIPRKDWRYFGEPDPAVLKGRRVIARGRLYRRGQSLQMTVRHPAALQLL